MLFKKNTSENNNTDGELSASSIARIILHVIISKNKDMLESKNLDFFIQRTNLEKQESVLRLEYASEHQEKKIVEITIKKGAITILDYRKNARPTQNFLIREYETIIHHIIEIIKALPLPQKELSLT